jgi:8-oxo-dGTP diphosphatase
MCPCEKEAAEVPSATKSFTLSVKVIVTDKNGRCLLLRRSASSKNNAGMWDFPGGKVDAGEKFDEALVREVEEETGLKIALEKVAGAAQSQLLDRIVVYLVMQGRGLSGLVTLSSEHDQFAWVPRSELASVDMCPQFRSFAEAFANSS